MPDNESELTGASVEFGVGVNRTIGVVQSETNNNSAETAEARDENGKVFVQKAYSKSSERTFEAIFLAGTTPPTAGSVITIGSGNDAWTGIVTAANITRANTDFTKISTTASHKDAAVLVAYS